MPLESRLNEIKKQESDSWKPGIIAASIIVSFFILIFYLFRTQYSACSCWDAYIEEEAYYDINNNVPLRDKLEYCDNEYGGIIGVKENCDR
tara:strand:+ start:553 stop:825 length:273 start_codon:yes stop_codon:yes gene_type:complete